ncbi:hypothetical protein AB0383_16535 [Amycolatopsis sp. NPDC051373]|uniref:hypothetical protein n=1 Tax=Amycolatopsis sp. NPDC051373 TaxID=3155801 RepID=UPI00344C7E30
MSDDPRQQNAPTTEDKVRAALADNPRSTPAALAMAAGVGRSTASKFLARWESEGTAIRTAGEGPRKPDTWALATPDHDAAAPDAEDAQPHTDATPSADAPTDDASDSTDTTTGDLDATEEADVDESATEDTTSSQEATADSEAHDNSETDAPAPADDGAAPSVETQAENSATSPDAAQGDPASSAAEAEPSAAELPAVADNASTDKDRLPKGGLRALVEEYLTAHASESFGPAKIGKVLSRSGGAVNNALEKLVADGYAIKTCEAPKRFAINPDKTDVPATAEGAAESAPKA